MRKSYNKMARILILGVSLVIFSGNSLAYYTTQGQNIIEKSSGAVVQLRGIGLGGWLLPEGYMWGIRVLDRPYQFENAIVDLIGERSAKKFWKLYHQNFMTRSDVLIMKSWGVNTLRIPLLASMLQPREDQPLQAPYNYDESAFQYLDDLVKWCEELEMGVIWDLHGAPGAQNAANISDSDGTARLWTEKETYWPMTTDLWDKITKRYNSYACIVGYDLLNEPLLARYPGVDPGLLRELYVEITRVIRDTDDTGIIFVEGDDWAQSFEMLEPLDWDKHLVIAFHSYPPTNSQNGLQRWDDLRQKYNIPLWHGETGEQNPPWELYKRSTEFLETANVGWNWWTHKKFDLSRQPWSIYRTPGFETILDYWKGTGDRPTKRQAKRWLFDQARKTNTEHCEFLPGMVESLHPLDPSDYLNIRGIRMPRIIEHPQSGILETGYGLTLSVKASGYPLNYQWYRNGRAIPGETSFQIFVHQFSTGEQAGEYHVEISNEKGHVQSTAAQLIASPFKGNIIQSTDIAPIIDGEVDEIWQNLEQIRLTHVIDGTGTSEADLGGWFSVTWDAESLYLIVRVFDDILSDNASIDYLKDGIEIYLDADNSKSTFYGSDEYQLRVVLDEQIVSSAIGSTINNARCAQLRLSDGYQIELTIPWVGLSDSTDPGHFLGLDIHVNDNDSNTRNGKLAWWAERDNSYQTPAVFGAVQLK